MPEPESVIFAVRLEFDVPAVVWACEDITRENSNTGAGDDVVSVVLSRFDTAVGDK